MQLYLHVSKMMELERESLKSETRITHRNDVITAFHGWRKYWNAKMIDFEKHDKNYQDTDHLYLHVLHAFIFLSLSLFLFLLPSFTFFSLNTFSWHWNGCNLHTIMNVHSGYLLEYKLDAKRGFTPVTVVNNEHCEMWKIGLRKLHDDTMMAFA